MRHRFFGSMSILAVLVAVVLLAPVSLAGQARTPAAKKGAAPRTPWGTPDLQGLWIGSTLTPMERPKELAGKPFLTAEEAAALEDRAAQNQFVERVPAAGDPGTYNQIWFDNGIKVVADRRTSLIVDPPDGRIPWRPGAQNAIGTTLRIGPFNSPADLDTGERCLTDGLPMLRLGYNPSSQIIQTPDYVVILHEMFHDRRIIPLDGRPHGTVRQWNGDIRGRWEGDTLVVETTKFVDKTQYRWAGTWKAPSETMRLVERFTRVDPETLEYQFTLEDPSKFTRPWTAVIPQTTNQASRGVAVGVLYEYACHEGNYAIGHVLRGARAEERAAGEVAKKGSR